MTVAAGEPAVVPAYFDAALVAKFYLNEPGRDAVRRLARASGVVVSSGIAAAEVSAAFHRKLREAAVTPAVFRALQGQFVHDVDEGLWSLRIRPLPCFEMSRRPSHGSTGRSSSGRSTQSIW
jgi:hypothetical protein